MGPSEKVCTKCKVSKALSSFYANPQGRYGRTSQCVDCTKARYDLSYYQQYRAKNRERTRTNVARWQRQLREEVLAHYGGKCTCCGESRYEFLAIDHIDGGGSVHRKKISTPIPGWLKRNGFPPGYRILCHNCNMALAYHSQCPHQVEHKESVK